MTDQQEATSSIADQIRERVRQADQDLIAKRADAAAVATSCMNAMNYRRALP